MQVDPPSVGTSSSAISSLAPSSSAFGTLSAFLKMDFATEATWVEGPVCKARTRELYPVDDFHLIHHLVTEELDKVGIGDVEGGIFAMLRMKVFPDKDMCVLGRGCSQARRSGAIPLEGHVGLRRWYLRPLGRAPV